MTEEYNKKKLISYIIETYDGQEKDYMLNMCHKIFNFMEEATQEDIHDLINVCEKRLLEINKGND